MVITAKASNAARATEYCDRILPNGSVPLPSNMIPARHIPYFTVITTITVRLLFYFRHFVWTNLRSTCHPCARWIPEGFSLGVERPAQAANHTPPCRAEVKKECSYTTTPPYVVPGVVLLIKLWTTLLSTFAFYTNKM